MSAFPLDPEQALARVHAAVRAMQDVGDADKVLYVVAEELQGAGLGFVYASVLLADLRAQSMHGVGCKCGGGGPYTLSKRPLLPAVQHAVESGEVLYRSDLTADDPFGELAAVQAAGTICVVDVPFGCGTIGLSHTRPHAFTPATMDWLRKLAVPLSDACGRLQDLRHLAERNRQLETEIAERRRTERELVRTQRLRAVAELSAGVSHNLNNLLTGILGPAQLLERMTDDPAVLRQVHTIQAAATRARDLVNRLRQSGRGAQEVKLEPVLLQRAVQRICLETWTGLQAECSARGARIQLQTRLEEVPAVRANQVQLHTVLGNLLHNAVEAMPAGGAILIETRALADVVELVFADTGSGMDEATQERLFEPFCTTRMDVGRGLGLSTVYGMVSGWGGTIAVESAPGGGTRFTVCLSIWDR